MTAWAGSVCVAGSLERQLGEFLRERRGEMTYAEFSRRLGLPPSTLYRLERGDQSITLCGLQQIMKRLRCTLSDIFGGLNYPRAESRVRVYNKRCLDFARHDKKALCRAGSLSRLHVALSGDEHGDRRNVA